MQSIPLRNYIFFNLQLPHLNSRLWFCPVNPGTFLTREMHPTLNCFVTLLFSYVINLLTRLSLASFSFYHLRRLLLLCQHTCGLGAPRIPNYLQNGASLSHFLTEHATVMADPISALSALATVSTSDEACSMDTGRGCDVSQVEALLLVGRYPCCSTLPGKRDDPSGVFHEVQYWCL
jgi:hypothetical protein